MMDYQILMDILGPDNRVVWAVLKEDTYETLLGDGYYAYLEAVFDTPTGAASFVESYTEPMYRLHIRRYDLKIAADKVSIRPAPSQSEPTTVEALASLMKSPASSEVSEP